MLTLSSRKRLYIVLTIVVIIIILLILPIRINDKLHLQGKVLPVKEWIIYKGTDGRLTSVLTDNKTGVNENYSVALFDRGDAIRFSINPDIHSGRKILINDTIGVVSSNEIERQIALLKGQIAVSKAELSVNLTGEKEAMITEEQKRLAFAVKQSEEQQKILARLKTLYEKGLASAEEYEIAKGTADLYDINIDISKARIETLSTGEKNEQVEFIKQSIRAFEKELEVLGNRTDAFTLLSPISGSVTRKTGSDTLLIIADDSEFILLYPVKVQERKYIATGQKVEVFLNNKHLALDVEIISIENKAHLMLDGTQVVIVTSYVNGYSNELIPGLMVDCYVNHGQSSPVEYLKRIWERLVN